MPQQRRPRRGSAYVSDVSSNSDDEFVYPVARHESQRRRSRTVVSSSSSSSESSDPRDEMTADGEDTDTLEDFVGHRGTNVGSVAKLDRLRRIFLNKPPRVKRTKHATRPKPKGDENHETQSTTTSNSSGESTGVAKRQQQEDEIVPAKMTLSIGHHVTALRDQVQRLARHHDAHAQQWQAMLTQAIEELTFVKQQEERALQSHARLVQESYALRLEIFEQQYRAKVAEIREAMRAEIAQQRQQSEAAVVAAAHRLQQQTQQLFQPDDVQGLVESPPAVAAATPTLTDKSAVLAKTTAFLERQRAREDARRRRTAEASPGKNQDAPSPAPPTTTNLVLSPVARQRAKLRALEEKLASFAPAAIERVVRTVEQQSRERQRCRSSTRKVVPDETTENEPSPLRPTPLSPLRRCTSYWHNGISREDPDGGTLVDGPSTIPQQPRARASLSRRFLLPEEERELRALRNSIGLAKDWMEQHAE